MKKTLTIALVLILLVSGLFILTGCGNNGENNSDKGNGSSSAIKSGKETTGSVIKASIPNGWILKAGKDITTVGYVYDADYIIKGSDVDTSAPTLQISLAKQSSDNIDNWKGWIDGGSYGDKNEPFEVNGVTWYTAKEGGVALIDGKVVIVYNLNGATFTDKEIQSMLGSITLIK